MFKKFRIIEKRELSYIASLKSFIFLISAMIVITGILGYLFVKSDPNSAEGILEMFKNLAQKTEGFSNHELLILIFLNNGLKILAVTFLGILFGLIPIFFTALNGFLIGMIAFIIQENHSWQIFWSGILPHGIFEIPALILGSAIGLRLGLSFLKFLKGRNFSELKEEIIKAFLFSFRVILPILLFAAFAEVFISQTIIDMLK